jgi:NAD(P)-dependent dehydrogenase (short-subunit alcohol dehydrogenase family)
MRFSNIKELFSLEGKVALVTGGASGLGKSIAEALLVAGCTVIITSRSAEKAGQIAQSLGKKAYSIELEATLEKKWIHAIEKITNTHNKIDILVNNAGGRRVTIGQDNNISAADSFIEFRNVEDWQYSIDANLTSTFLGCKSVVPIMKRNGYGKIINISSIDGMKGRDLRIYKDTGLSSTTVDYLASKAGIIGMTRGLAVALAEYGIRCNCLAPGGFFRNQPDAFVRNYCNQVPLGRMGDDAMDLAGSSIFLASAASDYITGICLPVDGGFTAW